MKYIIIVLFFFYNTHGQVNHYSIKKNDICLINFDKNKILSFYYQAYLEQLSSDKYHLFSYLSGSNDNTYSDQYASYVLKRKEDLFSQKLLDEYIQLV